MSDIEGGNWGSRPETFGTTEGRKRYPASVGLDDLGDPEPWLCGNPDPDDADLDRHSRAHEPYHCNPTWAPRPLCPNGCGCRKGTNDADRTECACDGPCCMAADWGPTHG